MASYLLDTSVLIWLIQGSVCLPNRVQKALLAVGGRHYLSHISVIEMIIKYRSGKLPLPAPPHEIVGTECAARAITLLPLSTEAIFLLEKLPQHHKDPFDRLLVCQAIAHEMTIVTPDKALRKYKAKTLW